MWIVKFHLVSIIMCNLPHSQYIHTYIHQLSKEKEYNICNANASIVHYCETIKNKQHLYDTTYSKSYERISYEQSLSVIGP